MIKEEYVLKEVKRNNRKKYIDMGYDIPILEIDESVEIKIPINKLSKSSRERITAICQICGVEKEISYMKYLVNYNRNNKGYYSCFKCKTIELKKTCLKKYGVDSYSKTEEFKETESKKWKGIQKGSEKMRETMKEKYGVESYFQTQEMRERNRKWMSSVEFKKKSKKTLLKKYGVDSYSKTEEFKKRITENKEDIINKIKKTFKEKYGVEWVSETKEWKEKYNSKLKKTRQRIIETCLKKYGVENVSQNKDIYEKILNTKINRKLIVDIKSLSEWGRYKRECRNLTNKNKKFLFEKWDGYDYYDGEYIKDNFSLTHTNKNYPTIDHKISVFYGFSNGLSSSDICNIDNLCITKRSINSIKRERIEEEFIQDFIN